MTNFEVTKEYYGMSYVKDLPWRYHIGIRKIKTEYLAYFLDLESKHAFAAKKKYIGTHEKMTEIVKQWIKEIN